MLLAKEPKVLVSSAARSLSRQVRAMVCPQCRSERCHRSKRRSIKDYTIGLTGLRPWRCGKCDRRYYAGIVAVRFTFVAHCRRCGNFDLQRISRGYVDGAFAWLFRLALFRAYRCDPCRFRFFSILPRRNLRSAGESPTKSSTETPMAAK